MGTNNDTSTNVLNKSTRVTWSDVVKKGLDSANVKDKNVVSRDHSLETIQYKNLKFH